MGGAASTALANVDVDRLGKLIRLIFGSDRPGEITAAVAAVRRTLAANNVDHHWLADVVERGAAPIAVPVADDDDDDRSAMWFAFHRRWSLSPRDRQFIERLTTWCGPLSEKQRKWLADICDKLAVAA